MNIKLNSSVRALILIMIALVITSIVIAKTYYGNINKLIDPRIVNARKLYAKYDNYAQEGDYYRIFALLDSIENIYRATKHYESSFELGVLHNNKAAAFLTISMFTDSIPKEYNPYPELRKDSLVFLAETNILKAISIYNSLETTFSGKSEEQICKTIEQSFLNGLENINQDIKIKYLETRAKDIEKAVLENDRRLSVCHTNLGIVFRQKGEYKQAAIQYKKALELWDRNLNAENNLNRLLGKPIVKRNFIQKLFPPERDQ